MVRGSQVFSNPVTITDSLRITDLIWDDKLYEDMKGTYQQHNQLPPRPSPIHFVLSYLLICKGDGDQSNVYHSATETLWNHIQVRCTGMMLIFSMIYIVPMIYS